MDVMFGVATPNPSITAQGVPTKASIPSTKPVPIGEGTYTKGVNEIAPAPAETLTP